MMRKRLRQRQHFLAETIGFHFYLMELFRLCSNGNSWVLERKRFHFLALISRRNVGMRGHLRKEIVLLKYQFFRFMTKSGGQFELLN